MPVTVIHANAEEEIETDDHDGNQTRIRVLRVVHGVVVRGDRPDADELPPEEALDPLTGWATRALMADGAFESGLVAEIREVRGSGESIELEETYAARAQEFEITYFTHETDPEIDPA